MPAFFWPQKTFEEGFSKNTLYRFLNSVKTKWQRFTVLLSSRIINDFMKPLTDEKRKDVFIIDDNGAGQSICFPWQNGGMKMIKQSVNYSTALWMNWKI